ncbi:rhodanese-like domain-containing protein [Peribacillus acanthi]|uniref:rhodanese-like domain-containing protein n=1 Tax=Peribacillus acanthi TaxID=2171554 RepID=UPI000D3EBF3C|nr:rhodanese-like domain-containing protein [Peribacillus acanthi]
MTLINGLIIALIIGFFLPRILPAKGINHITTTELKQQLKDKNKQFIDVRSPGEYKVNHIKEFKNIPLHLLSGRAGTLSKEKEVVVICQSGMRSNKASKELKKLGFTKVTNVKGGMSAW